MDIQQQTKNVAAQGRFGDSMLLHVNPAEVKGLASAVPLTVNPETGQPEAFLPFLAPVLGSMLAPTLLAGTGLSAGAMAGIGAGLATYAQTGGSGSKALLSGLTAGLGTRALQGAAQGTQAGVDAAISTPTVDPSFVGPMPTPVAPVTPPVAPPIDRSITAGESLKSMFTQPDLVGQVGGFDAGMKSLAGAAMSPSGMAAGTAAGTAGVIASQEEFERQMAQMGLDEKERKRRMYEMYPEQIPMASGGRTGFAPGRQTGYNYPAELDGYLDRFSNNSNYGGYNNPYQNSSNVFNTPRQRRTRPIGPGFMPGFMPEYSYFEGMNPSATALDYNPLGTSQRDGRSRGIQPMAPPGGFRDEGRYGYNPPPMFGGYGNPFMQSPSYQGFYGVPQMQQMINPYAAFSQMPMPYQPYQPYTPPVETPPDDGGTPPDDGDGTGGGVTPPVLPPIDIPGDGGFGRKGAVTNPDPIAPPDDFVNPIVNPPVGGPAEPPITPPVDFRPPGDIDFGGKPGTPPVVTPPPTITIPIEGGADVTIPDYSRPQPPRPEPVVQPVPEPVAPPAIVQPPVITPPRIEPPINENPIPFKPPSIIQPPVMAPPMQDEANDRFSVSQLGSGMNDLSTTPLSSSVAGDAGSSTQLFNRGTSLRDSGDTRDYASMTDDEIRKLIPQISQGVGANRKTYPVSQEQIDEFRFEKTDPEGFRKQQMQKFPTLFTPEGLYLSEHFSKYGTMYRNPDNYVGGDTSQPSPIAPPPDGTPENPFPMQPVKTPFVPVPSPIAPPPIAPPVQSGPQPIPETVKAPDLGAIPVTGQGNIFNAKPRDRILPAGPIAPPINTGRQIPSGPSMGGIGSFTPGPQITPPPSPMMPTNPTPAAPGNTPPMQQPPKPPMSGGIFGAPMFAEGGDTGDTELPNEGLEALAKTEKGREAVEAMGYQEGGQTDIMQDPITQNVIMFILGETDNENAINAFVEKYGAEQFMFLRDKILKQAAGNPDAQTEGLIQGNGNSGMADDLPMNIGDKPIAAVSQDEYIIPADVVSMLGDGSSDAGSKQLDGMLDRVRQAKTGGKTQAPPLNTQKVMPA